MKPPIARKLAVRHASFLATGGFKFGLQECLFKYITFAAIRIYAQNSEDAAKRGGWRPCIKQSWKLHV